MKVVCIDDNWVGHDVVYPVKNVIYTVRGMSISPTGNGYLLVEISNPEMQWSDGFKEPAFDTKAFRPITDISALQKLTKIKERTCDESPMHCR